MNTPYKEIEFTRELHEFLVSRGFTHILSNGVRMDEKSEQLDEFWLEPLKPTDERIAYEETDQLIELINSAEVMDMVNGDPFIRFMMELPVEEYNLYIRAIK